MGTPAVEALSLNAITKRFGALTATDAVSLSLDVGEVVALLGENGAGKTTLMNILFGQYTADSGTVQVFGCTLPCGNSRAALDAGMGMVHQHFTLADNLSVQENITLGVGSLLRPRAGRTAGRERIPALSQKYHLAVAPDARVGDPSVGERQRVEILKALYRDVRILILDEPTAVLTPQETDDLFATLRLAIAEGLSIIFISQKLHEVMAISDHVMDLRHGKVSGTAAHRRHRHPRPCNTDNGSEATPPEARLPRIVEGLRLNWGFVLAILFAAFDALQIRVQQTSLGPLVPCQIFLMMPYILSIIALVVMARRAEVPAALMGPFNKGQR